MMGGWYAWQLDVSLPVQYGDPRELITYTDKG